jgi:hypothetical protein
MESDFVFLKSNTGWLQLAAEFVNAGYFQLFVSQCHVPQLEGTVTMRAHLPKHPFLCDSCVPFQELIYWRFRSNWLF